MVVEIGKSDTEKDWYLPEISSVLDNLNGDLFSGFCRPGKSVKI